MTVFTMQHAVIEEEIVNAYVMPFNLTLRDVWKPEFVLIGALHQNAVSIIRYFNICVYVTPFVYSGCIQWRLESAFQMSTF